MCVCVCVHIYYDSTRGKLCVVAWYWRPSQKAEANEDGIMDLGRETTATTLPSLHNY